MKLRIESSRLVTPLYEGNASPNTTSTCIPLSVFDKVTYDIQVSLIFAYRAPTPPNIKLETGLRKALSLCRTWAGRLGKDDGGDPVILLNDEGVRFIEASADCAIHEVQRFDSPETLEKLHPRPSGVAELAQVQLTRFACGSLVVGLTHHHLAGDGPTMCKFMLAWCQATRGAPVDPLPLREDTIFTPRDPPRVEFEHRGREFMSKNLQEVYSHDSPVAKDIVVHRLHFAPDFLAKLKTLAASPRNANYTTFESLLAHLWRVVSRARGLAENESTSVRVSVDGRYRMNPRKPNYFGNLMLWAFPSSNVKELLNRPLSYAARLIHDEVGKVDDNYFKSFIDFASHKVKEEELVPTAAAEKPVLSPGVEVDCWIRFPINSMDFGAGRPFLFLPDYPAIEGLIFLLPSLQPDGGIDAFVGLFKNNVVPFTEMCFSLPLSRL